MRGVAGLELEILRAKAAGLPYVSCGNDAIPQVYADLLTRGLITFQDALPRSCSNCGQAHVTKCASITPIGRIVLQASL